MKNNAKIYSAVMLAFASIMFWSLPSFADEHIWPSDQDMKKHFENSRFIEGKRGDTRGFDQQFQEIIDAETPVIEQALYTKATMQEDGTNIWSFDAKSQFYTWTDLNNDGLDDVMLQMYHTSFCGSVGCESYLLLNTGNAFKKVNRFSSDSGFSVGATIYNGFKTVFAIEQCGIWDGEKYDFRSATRETNDSEDWNPHYCGGNYNKQMLEKRENCKTCHQKAK